MLRYAYEYKDQLSKLYVQAMSDPKYKFLRCEGYTDFTISIDDTTWSRHQYVSVNSKGEVIGYLSASIDNTVPIVSSLYIANFYERNVTFSKDFYAFLDTLMTRYSKVSFTVVVGNPAETMYDRVIKKYGGRVVGIKEDHVSIDGALYDFKMYEILRRNYEAVKD